MYVFKDMYELVINMLKNSLPEYYHYHNYLHSQDVVKQVKEIGAHEHCTIEEINLLQLAALWHDTGFLVSYENHEAEGCRLVKKYFPHFGINSGMAEQVCDLIMATKLPQMPKSKLEEIIADADLEYLGTDDAPVFAGLLYNELKHRDPALNEEAWRKTQIVFLQHHRYFTPYCKQYLQPKKEANLNSLLEQIQ